MKSVLLLALLLPASATAGEPIDFHDTNAQVLATPAADVEGIAAAWFARCAAGGEFADLAGSLAPDPHLGREQREAAARGFDRARFERIAQETFDAVAGELPQRRLTLCLDFADPDDGFVRDRMGGVVALTAGSGRIVIKLHPDADWATLLPYVLAHELHHSYWAGRHFDPAAPFTLADYLVFEGRADNFAMKMFGHHPAPWIDALTEAEYEATLATFRPKLADTAPDVLTRAMFGDPEAGIPPWAGYTIGYRLVAATIGDQAAPDWRAITAQPAADFMPAADDAIE